MSLSGSAYVPMRCKEDDVTIKATPTKILEVKNCEHKITICIECAPQWAWDWDIFWNRTKGGRNLYALVKDKLDSQR